MVIPESSTGGVIWRYAGIAILILGLWTGRREPALIPWLLLAATKVITTAGFYGYAREGVVIIPVFALLAALLVIRGLPRYGWFPLRFKSSPDANRLLRISLKTAVALVAIEGGRWFSKPVLTMDGQRVGVVEPFPATQYRERYLQVVKDPE